MGLFGGKAKLRVKQTRMLLRAKLAVFSPKIPVSFAVVKSERKPESGAHNMWLSGPNFNVKT